MVHTHIYEKQLNKHKHREREREINKLFLDQEFDQEFLFDMQNEIISSGFDDEKYAEKKIPPTHQNWIVELLFDRKWVKYLCIVCERELKNNYD